MELGGLLRPLCSPSTHPTSFPTRHLQDTLVQAPLVEEWRRRGPERAETCPRSPQEPEAESALPSPLLGFVCTAATRQPASWHLDSELLGADKQDPGEGQNQLSLRPGPSSKDAGSVAAGGGGVGARL